MTPEAIAQQLSTLGVRKGSVLVVHSSYRAVRPVKGGPQGVIEALLRALGSDGTLVMPTMTAGDRPYDPAATETVDMGIIAETFWRRGNATRSAHPGASFAAEGPLAKAICADHPLAPPHGIESPIGRVYRANGQILLVGVGHSENTSLHLAEDLAEVPYSVEHPCVVIDDGRAVVRNIPETDHCCEGFNIVDQWLDRERAQKKGRVGNATCRLMEASVVVDLVVRRLKNAPLTFLCPPTSDCLECRLAHASIGRRQ